jgi:hypothetical protein
LKLVSMFSESIGVPQGELQECSHGLKVGWGGGAWCGEGKGGSH